MYHDFDDGCEPADDCNAQAGAIAVIYCFVVAAIAALIVITERCCREE